MLDFLINSFLKYTYLSFITFYISAKIMNYINISTLHKIVVPLSSIILGCLYSLLISYIPSLVIILILILIISFIINKLSNYKLEHCISISFISMTIGTAGFIISMFISSIIAKLPFINLENQNPIIFLMCAFIESFFIIKFFKIRRFSKGVSFLQNEQKLYNISINGLILSGALIIFSIILGNNKNRAIQQFGIVGFALIIIGTFIWIKRNITLDYQDRMKNRKIENLEKELADKEKINAELTEEIKSLTMINHQYNSRIKAAKQEIEKLAFAFKNSTNAEFSTELSEVTKLVNNLSSEYSNKVNSVLKYSKPLPKTNVKGVDSILEHMKLEATKKNIDFDLKVNCSVKHLIEKFISQSELETLISDHVKDAIIAVGYNESTPRSICVIFDIIDNCYRFSVYDSGIDFEIDTLVNLGLDAITTHKDDGGTGLGFLTTFGTLDKCKASLVIDEINFKNSNFSKSVNIIFDGKHEYIVRSSRTEEIKKFDKNSRIILQNKD